ncbi:MAG: DUF4266 domain-containing protein [Methylovulum sp.]|nr:DUF4266 domain-containing protein [Methylovulum sp.]MCF8000099.1 DUF4266 domain-containing protein [Methylovulum sp.]
MRIFKIPLIIVLVLSAAACTHVLPRQRGNLALPQMALTTDALEFGFRQHTAFSKEAAFGGYGGGGGGCGCN